MEAIVDGIGWKAFAYLLIILLVLSWLWRLLGCEEAYPPY
jgi:hypothetical protein